MVQGDMNKQQEGNDVHWLQEKGHLTERPFNSSVPLIGPFIAGFRTLWNNVAAKWYVRPLIQQQNEFNTLLVQRICHLEDQIYPQIIALDREQTRLNRETAEIALQLAQISRVLHALDERLARLEAENGRAGGPEGI